MTSVSTSFKRLFVRNLLWTATADSTTVLALLQSAASSRVSASEKGKVITATAGNGHSVTFEVPADFNTTDAVELIGELVDRYYEATAQLSTDGNDSPTDTQIVDEILDKLRAVTSLGHDFSGLRIGRAEVTT